MRRTVILPWVSVPVLSEQIKVVLPKVSTAGSFRIRAWRLAMRRTPSDRLMATTAGKASGTAATARAMPQINISRSSWPLATPSPARTKQRTSAPMAIHLPVRSRLISSGVLSGLTS